MATQNYLPQVQYLDDHCGQSQEWRDAHWHAQHAELAHLHAVFSVFVWSLITLHMAQGRSRVIHTISIPSMMSVPLQVAVHHLLLLLAFPLPLPSSWCPTSTMTPWLTTCATPSMGPSSPWTIPPTLHKIIGFESCSTTRSGSWSATRRRSCSTNQVFPINPTNSKSNSW